MNEINEKFPLYTVVQWSVHVILLTFFILFQENGIRINLFAWECYDSLIPFAWVALEYLVLLLFQVAAVVLAFKTRKVRIKELNDSKSVAAIIYITSMVMAALIVITFATDGLIVLAETLFSGSMMLATSVILALLFIPKVCV